MTTRLHQGNPLKRDNLLKPDNRGVTLRSAAAVSLILALLQGPIALAMPPEALNGEPVQSIAGANGIRGWSHIDNQRVLVELDQQSTYLLTLKHQCHGLAWAQNVTVTMTNNTIWAGFDAIQADGLACPIGRIEKVDSKKLLELNQLN